MSLNGTIVAIVTLSIDHVALMQLRHLAILAVLASHCPQPCHAMDAIITSTLIISIFVDKHLQGSFVLPGHCNELDVATAMGHLQGPNNTVQHKYHGRIPTMPMLAG